MNSDVKLNPSLFKLKTAVRNQFEFRTLCLEDLVPENHKARRVWDFVSSMDLSSCLLSINSSYGKSGRPAIDPRILLTLWIYTILDGNASARKLEELCINHDTYKWICGGVSASRTILAEFRSRNPSKFDDLLTKCLAVMIESDLISDTDFSQDGTRIKANAGNNSYHRKETLEELENKIADHIEVLKKEKTTSADAYEKRKAVDALRRAHEKKDRITLALKNLEEAQCEKIINGTRNNRKPSKEDLENVRASTTDPEARKMKMGDSGYRIAYNIQFATGLDSRVIYAVDAVKTQDPGTPPRLMAQVQERLKKLNVSTIKNWIADAAYSSKNDIVTVANLFPNCFYYAPPKPQKGVDPKQGHKNDCDAVTKWRASIGTVFTATLYQKRCSTAEFSNMHVKNQALKDFSVRGLVKVKSMALLHAIAMNISRSFDLVEKKLKNTIF